MKVYWTSGFLWNFHPMWAGYFLITCTICSLFQNCNSCLALHHHQLIFRLCKTMMKIWWKTSLFPLGPIEERNKFYLTSMSKKKTFQNTHRCLELYCSEHKCSKTLMFIIKYLLLQFSTGCFKYLYGILIKCFICRDTVLPVPITNYLSTFLFLNFL